YIGTIWPWYPWNDEWLQVHPFNTPFDLRVEIVLFIVAAVIVLALGPLKALRNVRTYNAREGALTAVLAAAFAAMAALQGGYFFIISQGPGLDLLRSALLASIVIALLAAMTVLLFAVRGWSSYAH
ncbi:MAG TPA: hypothetical protein VHS28_09625, partial [Chloroflexota bacterium]|nr:hypothetical protein [Chloroflexota bacterium]